MRAALAVVDTAQGCTCGCLVWHAYLHVSGSALGSTGKRSLWAAEELEVKFPRAEAERRSPDRTDLWEERGGASWGFLVVNALRARELYVVRHTPLGWHAPA